MRKCKRCGTCCSLLPIWLSPAEMRKTYTDWVIGKAGRTRVDEIYLLYLGLAGLCHGKYGSHQYVYGPCRFLEKTGSKYACAIHKDKPKMCKNFPEYKKTQSVDMGMHGPNPCHIKGCGLNTDKNHGSNPADWKLKPLKKSEK